MVAKERMPSESNLVRPIRMLQNLFPDRAVDACFSRRQALPKADLAMAGECGCPIEGGAGKGLVHVFDVVLLAIGAIDAGAGVRGGMSVLGLEQLVDAEWRLDQNCASRKSPWNPDRQ